MASAWVLNEERLPDATDADRERLRAHLADGVLKPAVVVRLEPLVVACAVDDAALVLLVVEWPDDAALIRRCRLRMDSRLSAIVSGGVPVLGELIGDGPPAEAPEAQWRAIQTQAQDQIRATGWLVRSANPLVTDATPGPLDQLAPQRQVIVVTDSTPPSRQRGRWGWLLLGIALVVVLKLLLMAVRRWW